MSEAIPPLTQYAFMAWCLVKHRDNFTFICTDRLFSGHEADSVTIWNNNGIWSRKWSALYKTLWI